MLTVRTNEFKTAELADIQRIIRIPAHERVFHILISNKTIANRWDKSPISLNIFIFDSGDVAWKLDVATFSYQNGK